MAGQEGPTVYIYIGHDTFDSVWETTIPCGLRGEYFVYIKIFRV